MLTMKVIVLIRALRRNVKLAGKLSLLAFE